MQFPSSASTNARPWLWLAVLLAVALTGCREKTPVILSQFTAFGVQVDVSLVGVSREQARQASAIVAQDFTSLERDWADTPSGRLQRVNRLLPTSEPFVPPPSMLPLIRLCKTYETESGGLFDPAIGKLTELWGFDRSALGGHPPPTRDAITRLTAAKPSMAQIEIDGLDLIGHNPALALDFGAVAKGAAIDLAIEHLRDLGVRNALIEAEGVLRAIGDRSGQPWRIPIRRASGSAVFAIVAIRGDESLATAAEYDRNFVFKGKLYHAIIDPRTGWPASESRTVTVVHQSAASAAAAAAALFVAGPEEWQSVAAAMQARYALLVDVSGRVHMTRAMADRIELVDNQQEIVIPKSTSISPRARPADAAL